MAYKINFEMYSDQFALPKKIINDDFEKIDAISLKVILLIFKNSDKHYSVNLLSNLLCVSEKETQRAIDYWVNQNVLIDMPSEDTKVAVVLPKTTVGIIPNVTIASSKELKYLLDCMESKLKRPVTSAEQKVLLNILEYLKLPADVVLMAIEYCASIDKANPRYIEKLCVSWSDSGINTHERAEQHLNNLKRFKSKEKKIQKLLSIDNRSLINSESEFITKWINQYGSSLDMIKLAYEKTIQNINKLSFPYMNTILQSWYEQGYKSVADVKADNAVLKRTSSSKSYDIDDIDRYWDNVPKLK